MQDDELPYDYTQDHLEVADHDFGIFCYDAMEHPERYDQKTIKIKGKFIGRDKVFLMVLFLVVMQWYAVNRILH